MAPRNALSGISFMVDSGSEDDVMQDELNALPTPDSNAENKAPARKARGMAAQTKKAVPTTKPAAKGRPLTRRVSAGSVVGAKKSNATVGSRAPSKGRRKALAERKETNGNDTEEVDEFDQEEPAIPPKPTRRGRPTKKEKEPTVKKQTKAKHTTIPETQLQLEEDPMDIEESIEVVEIPESMAPPPPRRPSAQRAQAQPSKARQSSNSVRRTGSVSDSERDPVLRRKVGEVTRKLEAMTVKYDTLKEAASTGKESNFEQLRKRTEQTAKDQDAVIKALKQQLSDTQLRTADLTSMKKQLTRLSQENIRLGHENKKLADSLIASQNESKTLSNKLAAARSSAQPETRNVPGSAVKPRATGVVLPGTIEAAKEVQLAKQKVDLYSDFTNLVVLGIKKNEDEEEVYDCLQTGRNGTLHFHLTVAAGSESYEDTEFIYQPLLDEQRDKELLNLLPDYLTEEIFFPRRQAARFHCKIVDSMSKKITLEDE